MANSTNLLCEVDSQLVSLLCVPPSCYRWEQGRFQGSLLAFVLAVALLLSVFFRLATQGQSFNSDPRPASRISHIMDHSAFSSSLPNPPCHVHHAAANATSYRSTHLRHGALTNSRISNYRVLILNARRSSKLDTVSRLTIVRKLSILYRESARRDAEVEEKQGGETSFGEGGLDSLS